MKRFTFVHRGEETTAPLWGGHRTDRCLANLQGYYQKQGHSGPFRICFEGERIHHKYLFEQGGAWEGARFEIVDLDGNGDRRGTSTSPDPSAPELGTGTEYAGKGEPGPGGGHGDYSELHGGPETGSGLTTGALLTAQEELAASGLQGDHRGKAVSPEDYLRAINHLEGAMKAFLKLLAKEDINKTVNTGNFHLFTAYEDAIRHSWINEQRKGKALRNVHMEVMDWPEFTVGAKEALQELLERKGGNGDNIPDPPEDLEGRGRATEDRTRGKGGAGIMDDAVDTAGAESNGDPATEPPGRGGTEEPSRTGSSANDMEDPKDGPGPGRNAENSRDENPDGNDTEPPDSETGKDTTEPPTTVGVRCGKDIIDWDCDMSTTVWELIAGLKDLAKEMKDARNQVVPYLLPGLLRLNDLGEEEEARLTMRGIAVMGKVLNISGVKDGGLTLEAPWDPPRQVPELMEHQGKISVGEETPPGTDEEDDVLLHEHDPTSQRDDRITHLASCLRDFVDADEDITLGGLEAFLVDEEGFGSGCLGPGEAQEAIKEYRVTLADWPLALSQEAVDKLEKMAGWIFDDIEEANSLDESASSDEAMHVELPAVTGVSPTPHQPMEIKGLGRPQTAAEQGKPTQRTGRSRPQTIRVEIFHMEGSVIYDFPEDTTATDVLKLYVTSQRADELSGMELHCDEQGLGPDEKIADFVTSKKTRWEVHSGLGEGRKEDQGPVTSSESDGKFAKTLARPRAEPQRGRRSPLGTRTTRRTRPVGPKTENGHVSNPGSARQSRSSSEPRRCRWTCSPGTTKGR